MAMTEAGLSAAIKAEIIAEFGPNPTPEFQQWCDAMGKAIIQYIKANADVQPGTFESNTYPVTGLGTLD